MAYIQSLLYIFNKESKTRKMCVYVVLTNAIAILMISAKLNITGVF